MRLLKFGSHGELSLTNDLIEDIPRYAILSHTWGADDDEVTFNDLKDGSGKSKAGYEKIQFCGEQARKDGLQYFWVDTCCIDKTDSAELSEAINSMFLWYRNASTCFAYLCDVPGGQTEADCAAQDSSFRAGRWFTRGWTLQELLAALRVAQDWETVIGTKWSLRAVISSITSIPEFCLGEFTGSTVTGGNSGFYYSISEILSWASKRVTTRKEDIAYSLMGLFGIHMPILYGEDSTAFLRLQMGNIETVRR
jgi:hypothetical protein